MRMGSGTDAEKRYEGGRPPQAASASYVLPHDVTVIRWALHSCRSGTLTACVGCSFARFLQTRWVLPVRSPLAASSGNPGPKHRSPIINDFRRSRPRKTLLDMPLPPSLEALDQRRSVPSMQLGEPGPDPATLLRMLESAVRVPDHGKLVPFRFLRIAGDARHALGEFLARRTLERDPDAPPAMVEKDRLRFSRAPVVVAVVARIQRGHKVPEQ